MPSLTAGTYPAFTENYIKLVEADTIDQAIGKYADEINRFYRKIPEGKLDYRYADGKWSIKEVLQHLTDAERIFAYRALRIARYDKTPLPGFDENAYAAASNAGARTWESLITEFEAVRKSSDLLLLSFSEDQISRSGTTNNSPNTVLAIGFTMYGHILHHIKILKERYL